MRGPVLRAAIAATAALGLLLAGGPLPAYGSAAQGLRPVPSPNQPPGPNSLGGAWAWSAHDAWAVGTSAPAANGPTSTLAEHWDGHVWRLSPVVNPAPGPNVLTAVAGSSSTDVWAVGYRFDAFNNGRTLVEHWNGTGWAIVPSPNVGGSGFLFAVSVLGPDDAFAVGTFDSSPNGFPTTLVEHWDGFTWTIQPSPNTLSFINQFQGVVALSTSDVWAVGFGADTESSFQEALVAHYDGTTWTRVATPGASYKELMAVTATSSHDVWAVGTQLPNPFGRADGLVEHWDGTAWSVVASPPVDATLTGVATASHTDAWAVGWSVVGTGPTRRSVAEHWDGSSWTSVPAPFGLTDNALFGAGETRAGKVWAVGTRADSTGLDLSLIATNCPMCA
jgi:hypothetical protein